LAFAFAAAAYDFPMTMRKIRYSVGNENNPSDPFGRSELVIEPDGAASLEHHFSRVRRVGGWTGRVDAGALDIVWTGLSQAGFPAAPNSPFLPGSSLRRLTVETDGVAQQTIVDWHGAAKLAGYAEAFDVLDGVIRQLSGDSVKYPTKQSQIVTDIAAVPESERA
jgi:hypothetical protein